MVQKMSAWYPMAPLISIEQLSKMSLFHLASPGLASPDESLPALLRQIALHHRTEDLFTPVPDLPR
jgi:hypothetical protein